MKRITALILLSALGGCVTTSGDWVKPGVSQVTFSQEKYGCMRENNSYVSMGSSSGYVSPYNGNFGSGYVTRQRVDANMFKACMEAHGYQWVQRGAQ